MKIDKTYPGLIDEGHRYKIEGDLVSKEDLVIELGKCLFVSGSINASGYIKAGWSIDAGGYIKAGRDIYAGEGIDAGGYIYAGGYIEAGEYIYAGKYIDAGRSIDAGWDIKCKKLLGGKVVSGILKEKTNSAGARGGE